MPFRSDFFTAKLEGGVYDRRYGAEAFARRFASYISSGIEIIGGGVLDDELEVSVVPASMQTQVNLGAVSILGRRGEVYDAPVVLTHEGADALNPRIDRVVMELNLTDSVRAIEPKIITGVPAATPEPEPLVRTSSIYQLCMATVLIPADVASIPTENVTDTRGDTDVCGIANIVLGIKMPDGNSAATISVDDTNFEVLEGTNQQDVDESADAAIKALATAQGEHEADNATEAELGHIIIGTGLDVTVGGIVSLETDVARFKRASSTYTDNDTAQTFTDVFCTANSLVIVVITSVTKPQGVWSVESGAGSFTITSTVAESADITFDYYIQKVV